MAFHVTQCPSCESTFNTSARLLESAAGKVRCGACLAVFQATDNLVFQHSDDSAEDDGESVFVGNNPLDYFDPSSFLTRSALQEQGEQEQHAKFDSAVGESPVSPSVATQLSNPEFSDSESEEFFAAISASDAEPVIEATAIEIEELFTEVAETNSTLSATGEIEQPAEITPDIDITAEEFIADRPTHDEQSVDHWEHEEHEEKHVEENEEKNEDSLAVLQDFPEFEITESAIPAPTDHEFAYDEPYTLEEFADRTFAEVTPVVEALSDPASEQEPAAETDTWSEAVTNAEPDSRQSEATTATVAVKPEDISLSFSFSLFQRLPPSAETALEEAATDAREPSANEEPSTDKEPSTNEEPSANAEPSAYKESSPDEDVRVFVKSAAPQEADYSDPPEQQLNHEISEHDFQETVADGLDESEFETALFGDTSEYSDFATITENTASDEQLLLATESAVVNQADEANRVDQDDAEPAATEAEDSTEAIRARVLNSGLTDEEALEAIPEENLAVLGQFSTPVELLAGVERRWGRLVGLALLFLMLSATFAGQYFWRHMSLYSQVAQLRPLFEVACTWLDCEVPTYSNIAEIRSDNLVVRSHPELENGLVVNIEFRNAADFPQPFPVLILSFNSASNEIVALREFEPREYLEPTLQSFNLMPVQSPLQIAMEIIDPGPGAVNYTLAFRSP